MKAVDLFSEWIKPFLLGGCLALVYFLGFLDGVHPDNAELVKEFLQLSQAEMVFSAIAGFVAGGFFMCLAIWLARFLDFVNAEVL